MAKPVQFIRGPVEPSLENYDLSLGDEWTDTSGARPVRRLLVALDPVEWADAAVSSSPPAGKYRVTNLYVQDGRLIVEWDDTPVE